MISLRRSWTNPLNGIPTGGGHRIPNPEGPPLPRGVPFFPNKIPTSFQKDLRIVKKEEFLKEFRFKIPVGWRRN